MLYFVNAMKTQEASRTKGYEDDRKENEDDIWLVILETLYN